MAGGRRNSRWYGGWAITSVAAVLLAQIRAAGTIATGVLSAAAGLGTAAFEVFLDRSAGGRRSSQDDPGRVEELRRQVTERWFRGKDPVLTQMVRHGQVLDVPVMAGVDLVNHDAGSRVVLRCPRITASELAEGWDLDRLVILGEPGHGKTVMALRLAKQANDRAGGPVVDVLSLNTWAAWLDEANPSGSLDEWIVDQLVERYQVDRRLAAQLVLDGRLIPILDGLDEVPPHRRSDCKQAIDTFADRAPPHRAFVLTCRRATYQELAPRWTSDDRRVYVCGFSGPQIAEVVEQRCGRSDAWDDIRQRAALDDPRTVQLFGSPLHLDIAIHAYGDDPRELIDCDPKEARSRVWEQMFRSRSSTVPGHTPQAVRAWLTYLATAMHRAGRLEFRLHDLPLYYPGHKALLGRYRSVVALTFAVVYGWVLGLMGFPVFWAVFVGALAGALAGVAASEHPTLRKADLPLGATGRIVRHGSFAGIALGLTAAGKGWEEGLGWWHAIGGFVLLGSWSALFFGAIIWFHEVRLASAKRPDLLDNAPHPAYGLTSTGRSGRRLAGACAGAAGAYVITSLVYALTLVGEPGSPARVFVGGAGVLAVFMLLAGILAGFIGGWDSWIYHHLVLRPAMARRGLIPLRLGSFLDLCTDLECGLLRKGSGYEFRHRELLEHLATHNPSDDDHQEGVA